MVAAAAGFTVVGFTRLPEQALEHFSSARAQWWWFPLRRTRRARIAAMNPFASVWLQFAACMLLIGVAGHQLASAGDQIARRTGLSGSWIGLALLATVTSLPELATGITSVTLADAPNLALGDALGSCVINLAFLVVVDFLHRSQPLYSRASQGHILAAGFGVILLGFIGISILLGQALPTSGPSSLKSLQFSFSLSTPVILLLYLVAVRAVFVYERGHADAAAAPHDSPQDPPLSKVVRRFAVAGAVVVGAGLWLPFVAVELAATMGWSRSFVGTLFVAFATSVPELAVTLSALRLGALDLAIGNLLGSNLFNVAIIAIDDLFYTKGPLLAHVSPVHAMTAGSAVIMTGLAVVGLFYRPTDRVLRAVGWISLGLFAVYLLNAYVLYLHGD